MLLKIVSFISLIILMFAPSVALPEKGDVLVETLDKLSENRTADEINGANGTRFYIQRPKADKLNEVNAADFGLSEDNAGEFFDKTNLQGKAYFGKYCNNIDYYDNEYIDGGFLDSKKIAQTDSISVWAAVNSQL